MSDFTSPRITEKRYLVIPPVTLTVDGTVDGVITVGNTYCFKVGQLVIFKLGGANKLAKIQRVTSDTQFVVVEAGESITTNNKLDMTAFTAGSTVELMEGRRPVIDLLEIQRQVYEEEPTVALRSHLVDWLGRSYDSTNPVPVQLSDGDVNIGTVNAELEVQLSHRDDSPDAGDIADSVRIGGGVANETVEAPNEAGRVRLATLNQKELPSQRPVKYITQFLLDGANSDMNVDGSVTPVVFEKVFGTGEIAFLEKLVIEIRDTGNLGLNDFGSGPALTNGILVEVQIGGVVEISLLIKTNAQMISAADVLFEVDQFQGSALLIYNFIFREPMSLNHNDDDDFIRVTIQDDLTSIEALKMAFKSWEAI